VVNFEQVQPLIHQSVFGGSGRLLFEEDGADGLLRNAVIFLPQEF
jgi:hypothetical protein